MTCPNDQEAERIASLLLDKKLIACANVINSVQSYYRWQGKIQKDEEVLVLLKTSEHLVDRIIGTVEAEHSYETPCVISLDIDKGSRPFLKWISEQTVP